MATTHEDGRAATAVVSKRIVFVRWATQSVDRALSTHPVAVVLEDRVSDPSVSLLQFQRAKGLECTFQSRDATRIGNHCIVYAYKRAWRSVDSTPVTFFRILRSILTIVVRVKSSTDTEAIVLLARENNATSIDTFSQQLCAVTEFNSRTFKLDDRTWIDCK